MLFIKEKWNCVLEGRINHRLILEWKKSNRNGVTVTRVERMARFLKSALVAQRPRLSLFHSQHGAILKGPNWEENQYDKLLLVLFPNCFGLEIDAGAWVIRQSMRTH